MADAIENTPFEEALIRKPPVRRTGMGRRAVFVFAFICALAWLAPFYYLAISIFKTTEEYAHNDALSLPEGVSPIWSNLEQAWTQANMASAFFNSALYGVVGAGLAVFFAAMAAFALARLNFGGKNFWFMLIFLGTIFPFQMYLIPLFFGYQHAGILNTRWGMLLLYTAICVPFPALVLRSHMSQISREVDEAARMDGAQEFRIFWSIILPNCSGSLVALFLLQFTWIWNDLLFSMVLGNRPEIRSIMNALQVFQGNYAAYGPNVALAASLLASIPPLAAFAFLRRHFMEGLKV
ncbi:permease [Labrys miyagiensis]|uniref:Permease n=1 Tax=Labrys miyagiensis TaxID=346912 RepID=A0ABQ6CI09_9HYPH|nr:carbohydrate ABC transporter permease [Labrys miyagiensis]GLS19982.1 permease [Labrys miyagiensis]